MLKKFFISFSIMFALTNVVADIGELIAPGNGLGTGGTKLGFYFVSIAFALAYTFLWHDKKEETHNVNEGTPSRTSSDFQ